MRILICDDNPIFLDELQELLNDYFAKNNLTLPSPVCYPDGNSVLSDTGEIDMLFLDMELPGHNGIYVGNMLKKTHPYTIILAVTSHPDFLDPAMHFGCFAYLTKPIDHARFFRNMDAAIVKYYEQSSRITIQTTTGFVPVQTRDIIFVESEKRHSVVHTLYGIYHCIQPFAFWQDQLSQPYFYVTHRSMLVNFSHIKEVQNDRILMDNGQYAYISRRRMTDFRKTLAAYYAGMHFST